VSLLFSNWFFKSWICGLIKFGLYWLKDSRLPQSIQFLYQIKGLIPPSHQVCSTEFGIFILPSDQDEELVVLLGLAAVSHAISGRVPGLTYRVGSSCVVIITFARVTWNYGSLCEFRLNCLGHQQGCINNDVHFALWRNKPSRA
jgi:hypothetical protein